jgi:hypothetical protein
MLPRNNLEDHKQGFLYASDDKKNEVRRYRPGETNEIVVAGGNEGGAHLNQLNNPNYIFIN